MTPDELLHLIAQGEGQRLEFKRSLAELEDAVGTIVAFANAEGGTLLFGVRADGTVIGVTLGANTRERVVNVIVDNTDPPLYPQVEYLELDGRTVIAVTVAAGHDRPHLAYGRAYRRVGAVTAQLSRDEQRRLLLESRPRFDDQPSGASLDDVDPARMRRFLETAIRRGRLPDTSADLPMTEALRRLKVLRVVDECLTPTMAAVLLIASKIYHARRAEITEHPFPAIREGIANAVIHRDYLQAGSRVQVAVYADRIEVENPGGLLPPITVETLGHTPPVWRNPDLAGLLYRAGYIEQFGTGIERMKRVLPAV